MYQQYIMVDMGKPVKFTLSASRWLIANRDFITEEVIQNVVKDFPKSKRMPLRQQDCFMIVFRRKRGSRFVEVVIWVHEYPSRLLVYKSHHY
jgi:hypothetical protein